MNSFFDCVPVAGDLKLIRQRVAESNKVAVPDVLEIPIRVYFKSQAEVDRFQHADRKVIVEGRIAKCRDEIWIVDVKVR